MDFNGAKKHVDMALELDPKYVKAWSRKGDIAILMKENHKALEAYQKGLNIDPENKACQQGVVKVRGGGGGCMRRRCPGERTF
jgi:stress-induced-phosphoprotein 1